MNDILVALLYLAGAIVSYGLSYAYWRGNWPLIAHMTRAGDTIMATLTAMLWPIFLPVSTAVLWVCDRKWPYRFGMKFRG